MAWWNRNKGAPEQARVERGDNTQYDDFDDFGVSLLDGAIDLTRLDRRLSERSALMNADAFASVRIISSTIARLPLDVFTGYGRDRRRVPIQDTPAAVFNRPGGNLSRQAMLEFCVRMMLTKGRALVLMNKDGAGRNVLSLQPRNGKNWQVHPMVAEDGGVGFRYVGPEGEHPADEILDFVYAFDEDFKPVAPLPFAARYLNLSRKGEEKIDEDFDFVAKAFLQYGSEDSGSATEKVGNFSDLLRRAKRNGGVLPLPKRFTPVFNQMAKSAEQNQLAALIESVGLGANKVLGVAPSILGDNKRNSYRTLEAAVRFLTRFHLTAIADSIEREIDLKLLGGTEFYCDFDESYFLSGDPKDQAQVQSQLVTAGIRTRNEARVRLGDEAILPTLPDGSPNPNYDPDYDKLQEPQNAPGMNNDPPGQPMDEDPSDELGM